jgi:hypothetical protein
VLVNAINAASWNGAGAESVNFMWIFLIAEAMLAAAQAQPSLQPSQSRQLICQVSSHKSQKVAILSCAHQLHCKFLTVRM